MNKIKKRAPIFVVLAILVVSALGIYAFTGASDPEKEQAEAEIHDVLAEAHVAMVDIGVLPHHAEKAVNLTEEDRSQRLNGYMENLKKYYAADSDIVARYPSILRGILDSKREEVDALLETGVFGVEILSLSLEGDTAFVEAELTTWSKAIGKDGENYDLELACGKVRSKTELVREDGSWKILANHDYQLSGWSDLPEPANYTSVHNNLNHYAQEKVGLERIAAGIEGEVYQVSDADYEKIKYSYEEMVAAALALEPVNPYEF